MGNRLAVAEANGDLATWSYDETYQLTRERRSGATAYDTTYTYDGVGNRLTKVESGAITTYSCDADVRRIRCVPLRAAGHAASKQPQSA